MNPEKRSDRSGTEIRSPLGIVSVSLKSISLSIRTLPGVIVIFAAMPFLFTVREIGEISIDSSFEPDVAREQEQRIAASAITVMTARLVLLDVR